MAIKEVKKLVTSQDLRANLVFIKAHLAFLSHYITKLEEQGMQQTDAVQLMEEARNKMSNIPGETGEKLRVKLDKVLEKNPGYDFFKMIAGVLQGTSNTFPEGMGPGDLAMLKYCPTTSVDRERSFNIYRNILSDKRQSFTQENLKQLMLCHCYYQNSTSQNS